MKKKENPLQQDTINWRLFFLVMALLWLGISLSARFFSPNQLSVSYTTFKNAVKDSKIQEITIKGQNIYGNFKKPVSKDIKYPGDDLDGNTITYDKFRTIKPAFETDALMGLLESYDVTVNVKVDQEPWFSTLLITLLPWVLIIGFFIYVNNKFNQKMGSGTNSMFGFGKSQAKFYNRTVSDVTFNDVSGLENTKKEFREIIAFLKNPEKFKSLGGEMPTGILLLGPPGVGKTLIARAVTGEAQVPFYSISGSEFIEMFVGIGASRVRDMFKKAKKDAPAIIFIDELDSIGRARGTGVGGGHDEREQTLNQILSEMDGFSGQESVIVIGATNRPDVLDPALVRPGRFDRRISLDLPHKEAREGILKLHTREKPLANNVDLGKVARQTVGLSGADLKNLTNEAALLAARKNKKQIDGDDFDMARDKITLGIERENVIKEEDKEIVAYHEAGHALAACLLPNSDPLEKVSIIPRGKALGVTEQIPDEDRYNLKKKYLLSRLGIMLAGRVAEQLVFEDISTGAGDDLKKASELARRMVCQWGMSDKIGPVTFRKGEQHPFLGREMTESRDFSEETAHVIDLEVKQILEDMEGKATDILTAHRKHLDKLANALIENESMMKNEISELLGDINVSE